MFKPPNPAKTAKSNPHLVRESFRTPNGPRSRTICNISNLPAEIRHLITSSLSSKATVHADSLEIDSALDFGGLAVLVDAWKSLNLDLLLADIGTPRQRALLKAMVFARLLFPCSKLALQDAQGTLLAAACGLPSDEDFDEDDLDAAMDSLTGQWCALEKNSQPTYSKSPSASPSPFEKRASQASAIRFA